MSRMVGLWLLLATLGVGTVAGACGVIATRDPGWRDGDREGRWQVVFTGYGTVSGDDDAVLLEPRSADRDDLTHGALVVTAESFPPDTDFAVTVATQAHLREGEPNPWEVGWVLWNYTATDSFYAVAVKPNGWEISKQDPAYPGSQRFLSTGRHPTFPIGHDYRVSVTQADGVMTVRVDDELLDSVVDDERPYREGAIGLYTEDARVRFTQLQVKDAPARR